MRVLQVMAGAKIGGAEAFFERLAIALHDDGLEQYAVIRKNKQRKEKLMQAGLPVTECRFGGPLDFVTPTKLTTVTRRFKPDLVMCWMSRAAAAAPRGNHITVARLGGYYDLKYYKRCQHLIGNTPDIKDYLIRSGWPDERAWYIPNFANDLTSAPEDRPKHGTPNDAPLLLCLGRLHQNKGFDIALNALSKVPNAYLWIAGDGPEEGSLKSQADHLGISDRVRFLGWRDDPAALLSAADIFVCSSRHEPLGNIVLEAWLHGTPIAACASQGPRFLIEDGITGLLSENEDAGALAKSIQKLIDEPTLGQALAQAGALEYQSKFSKPIVVSQYQEFFDHVVTQAKR